MTTTTLTRPDARPWTPAGAHGYGHQILDDATRREFLAGLAAAGLLAACGDGTGGTGGSEAASPGFPRDVDHEVGSTRIEAPPTRVGCVTDGGELAAVLALGVTPVGFGQRNDPLTPWTAAAGGDDPAIDRYPLAGEPNFEVMAAWRPDLLLGQLGFVTTDTIADYQAIAPTVATQSVEWRVSLRQVAAALGLEQRAEEIVADIEARTAEVADALSPLQGRSIAVLAPRDDGSIGERLSNSSFGLLLDELGLSTLPAPPEQEAGAAVRDVQEVVPERLGEVDAEVIIVLDFIDADPIDTLAANPLWANLPAVRSGEVAVLSADTSNALRIGTALSVPFALDALETELGVLA